MRYSLLGKTRARASEFGLGAMTFGEDCPGGPTILPTSCSPLTSWRAERGKPPSPVLLGGANEDLVDGYAPPSG
jgi:hypothetical protein